MIISKFLRQLFLRSRKQAEIDWIWESIHEFITDNKFTEICSVSLSESRWTGVICSLLLRIIIKHRFTISRLEHAGFQSFKGLKQSRSRIRVFVCLSLNF
jgi:hypothetical protein